MTQQIVSVYLDMDGVLVDLVRRTYRALVPGIDDATVDDLYTKTDAWDAMHRVLTEHLGREFTEQDLFAFWDEADADFWGTVPWSEYGQRIVNACLDHVPTLIMSTPVNAPGCVAGKMRWINELPPGLKRRYALTPCKHHFAHAGALLIDDGDHNTGKFKSHGGEVFSWPQPWNAAGQSGLTQEKAFADLVALLKART